MTQHEQKVEEAKAQFANKMQHRWNRDREYESTHKRLQDARDNWMLAKQNPRAEAIPTVDAAAFANGPMVRIKPNYWKKLQVPAAARSGSCHWRVSYFSGFSYTLSLPHSGGVLECVPPDAVEELDYELLPGSAVSIVEPPALPADVAWQLHQISQRCSRSGATLKQRRSDTTFEVKFSNRATLRIPNGNLRPPNQSRTAPQTLPQQPVKPETLLGFTSGDYVRDEEGRRGVVTALCSEDPLNLKVDLVSYSAHVSLPASTLTSEEVFFSQRVTKLTEEAEELKEELEKSCAAAAEADAQLKALQAEQEKFVQKHREAEDAECEAERSARRLRVVKVARFKTGDRPQEWRDISSCVTLEWSVAMETAGLREIVPLGVFKTAAYQVVGESEADHEEHIFSDETLGAFRLSLAVAHKILKHRNTPTADPLHSFALLKAALGAGSRNVVLDVEVQDFFNGPVGLLVPKDVAPPSVLVDTLRPYQLTGFRWLVNNALNGFGSLLADDMGLGKTLQTISLIMYLKHQNLLKPILIVVPSGLVQTWRRELEHWAKDLRVHLFYGKARQLPSFPDPSSASASAGSPKRRRLHYKQAEPTTVEHSDAVPDVVLTSYTILRMDAQKLAIPGFGGMILDEAQHIKNFNTDLSKAVKDVAEVVGHLRVALTGTPVENSLMDLHSIFDFILPGYLDSRSDFEKTFGQPLKLAARKGRLCNVAEEKRSLLNQMKEPFVLRRLKTDPAISADLPDKVQQTHECELSPEQRKIYTLVQQRQWAACSGGTGRKFKVLEMLQAMREVCNHPACLPEKRRPHGGRQHPASNIEISGKCAKFHELLDNILAAGEKALVFSSSLSAIDVLLQQIQRRKDQPRALKIIGDVAPDRREALIEQFQNDPNYSLLLLSQVGTVGLNLTAATHVIHFDRQYNPAKENQATDRALRIGQKRTVFVHFLISKDTFEERLAEILEQKQQLSDFVMSFDCEKFITEMDNEELQTFFMLRS